MQKTHTDLWRKFKSEKCQRSRDQLIENYLYIAKITASKMTTHAGAHVERDDLISAGIVGLVKAVDLFDLDRNIQFNTYAIPLVRGAIMESLRDDDWVPRAARDEIKILEIADSEMTAEFQRPPRDEEVAERIGWSEKKVVNVREFSIRQKLLSYSHTYTDSGEDLVDLIPAPATQILDIMAEEQERVRLHTAVSHLPPRERHVVIRHYWYGETFKCIAAGMGISESRAHQLDAQSAPRLQSLLQSLPYTLEKPTIYKEDSRLTVQRRNLVAEAMKIQDTSRKSRKSRKSKEPKQMDYTTDTDTTDTVDTNETLELETKPIVKVFPATLSPTKISSDDVFNFMLTAYMDEHIPNDLVGNYIRQVVTTSISAPAPAQTPIVTNAVATETKVVSISEAKNPKELAAALEARLTPEEIAERLASDAPYAGLKSGSAALSQIAAAKRKLKVEAERAEKLAKNGV